MKCVKMLGLAAVAAAALMAFVGASGASATVLCKTTGTNLAGQKTGTTCPANQAYPAGTEIHAVSEGVTKLTTSFKTIECSESTLSGKTTNEGSATETVVAHIETLTFSGCNCEIKVLSGGSLEIHWIEGTHNGTVTWTGTEVTTSCNTIFGGIHCIFKTNNTHVGVLTDSSTDAIWHIEEANIPRLVTSGLCAEKALWEGTYKFTTPTPLSVTGHT